jgi:hypothetical protein
MKRFLTLALAGALVLGAGSVAYANICAFDPVPAATLLFPFVAYNYELEGDGVNTLFAITNVSSEAQIAHVTLWTDYSVPVLDWNVLLTGYDVYTFDIRSILENGQIPPTFTSVYWQVEGSVKSPTYDWDPVAGPWDDGDEEGALDQGPVSNAQPGFTPAWGAGAGIAQPEDTSKFGSGGLGTCDPSDDAYPGLFDGLTIGPGVLGFFQDLLQGSQTANDGYFGCSTDPDFKNTFPFLLNVDTWWDQRSTADDTWAYVTVDIVRACNKSFPDDAAYWDDGQAGGRLAQNTNVLIGDVLFANDSDNFSEMLNAVHIEADPDIASVASAGPNPSPGGPPFPVTFYGRYSNRQPAPFTSDFREPLPTAWGFRWQSLELADGSSFSSSIRAFKANTNTAFTINPDLGGILDSDGIALSLWSRVCIAYTYYVWDFEENIDIVPVEEPPYSGGPGEEQFVVPNLLPLETQEIHATDLNTVGTGGWMLFVWPASNFANFRDIDLYYQTWMGVKFSKAEPEGLVGAGFSGATDGAVIANYNCFAQQTLPALGINFDYVRFGEYVQSSTSSE